MNEMIAVSVLQSQRHLLFSWLDLGSLQKVRIRRQCVVPANWNTLVPHTCTAMQEMEARYVKARKEQADRDREAVG